MEYGKLVELYQKLEATTKKLEMTDILAEFLKGVEPEVLPEVILLTMGRIFPEWEQKEVGVAANLMVQAIKKATGVSEDDIIKWWKESGDLGDAASSAIKSRRQAVLFKKPLTVEMLVSNLRKAAELEGPGTIEKKVSLVAELLASSKPEEARYIVRTILGELRVGVGEGIVRDAISKAFGVDANLVERAYYLTCDYGIVAKLVKEEGEEGLKKVKIELGRPIKVMLAQKAKDIKDGFEKVGRPCAIEFKYDGMRVQVHKKGDEVIVFTRRLENVTKQFPEIVQGVRECVKAKECVIEGEAVGYNPKTGEPLPFQMISRRIKRKYEIEEMAKQIPTETFFFDIVYLEGKETMSLPFEERRKLLSKIVTPKEKLIGLAKQIITSNEKEAEEFYQEALKAKQEGVMLKNLKAKYQPGTRVGYMLKLKPIMETLDLVIVGAEWGEGKRAKWLSSFLLACRDPESGKLLTVGKMATGLTEAQFEEMTQRLKPLITSEKGRKVEVKPKVVVEVGYQEIQKSPKYESGFALRFPRLIRFRDDKSVEEADTLERVRKLYESEARRV